MADAKIINYGQQISAGSTAIPDNTSEALDIESTDAKDYITIDTTDGNEKLVFNSGQPGIGAQVGVSNRGPRISGTTGITYPGYNFIGDEDTGMTHLGTGNNDQLLLVAGGQEGIRITEAGDAISAVALNGKTVITDGASGNIAQAPTTADSLIIDTAPDGGISIVGQANDPMKIAFVTGVQADQSYIAAKAGTSAFNQYLAFGTDGTERFKINGTGQIETPSGLHTLGALSDQVDGTFTATNGSAEITSGSSTAFTTDLHVGSALELFEGTTSRGVFTVSAIASATALTLDSTVSGLTSSPKTGITGKTDSGELFAVKTGDGKSVLAVNSTGVLTLSTSSGVTSSTSNIAIGDAGLLDAIEEDGVLNTIIAQRASGSWALSSAANNIIIGFGSGLDMTNAQRNVAIGTYALDDATSTQNSVVIGTNSGRKSGNDCVYIGHNTGDAATGAHNTAIGKGAFSATSTGTNNVAIGRDAMSAFTGSDSIAIGKEALDATSSARAVSVGYQSLTGLTATTTDNTAVGHQAGDGLDDGNECLFLGSGADTTDADGDNQIVIGYNAAGQGPDTVMLGNSSIGGLHCYTTSVTSPSDSRIKNNVENSSLGLDFINALRPVKYQKKHPSEFPEEIREARWADQEVTRTRSTDDGGTEEYTETTLADIKPADWQPKTEYGLIAQEVKAAMDAHGGADWQGHTVLLSGMEALGYGNLVTVLVKAVQELSARIATLEAGD